MLDLSRLPRTIQLVRAGKSVENGLGGAAASAVASFISQHGAHDGTPVLAMLDQAALPQEERYLCTADWRTAVEAIKALVVRGAPAIGIAGAAAVALRAAGFCYARDGMGTGGAQGSDRAFAVDGPSFDLELYRTALASAGEMVSEARPTAVNLKREVDRALGLAFDLLDAGTSPMGISDALCAHVQRLIVEDELICRRIGANGAELIEPDSTILTHCNAGSLATAFYGTALGVVYAAAEQGKVRRVIADETRPVGQGARLTAWELARAGVPVTLICDDMAASAMAQGIVDAVVVGADRIAANGDVANKIGTLGVAILAQRFGVPFYVAAPASTIDVLTRCGADIAIEERDPAEVLPRPIGGVDVWNPAFDVTPAELITAIITQDGVFAPGELADAI